MWSVQKAWRVENEANMQGKLSDVRKMYGANENRKCQTGSDLAKLQVLKCTFISQIKRKQEEEWLHQVAKTS